jgi:hypothetical protein
MATPFPAGLVAPQRWLDGIQPKVPTAGVDMIKHEVLTVARDLFTVSGAWRAWVGPILLNTEQTEYAIETADIKAECVGVVDAIVSETGDHLEPIDEQMSGSTLLMREGDYPAQYYCPTDQTIVFLPYRGLTSVSAICNVSLYIKMKPIDLDFPQHLASTHYDAICEGVLASLYSVPGLMYKPDAAKLHFRKYVTLRSRARRRAEASYTMRQNVVRPVLASRGTWRGRRP